MESVAILLFYAACAFVLIVVHESGHYLAGLVGGIPARDMRIRLFCFPQHVVLRSADQWVSPVSLARIHVGLGERDAALTQLERAYEVRAYRILEIRVDDRWDPVRDDPRFDDLLRRVGLQES